MTVLLSKLVAFITALFIGLQLPFIAIVDTQNPRPDEVADNASVILLIGDGMGFNSIRKLKKEEGIKHLNMDDFELTGESITHSASSPVTDSAAGGTALATGTKVINDTVGVYPTDVTAFGSYPMNLTELAISLGKAAGVVTTDSTSGATPSDFTAHTSDRDNEEDITDQQLHGGLNLLWGTETDSFTVTDAAANGWTTITDKASMDALTGDERSFGQFTGETWHDSASDMPQLYEMTEKAIDILDNDEDGFFLMVEGAHIDKNSHNNNGDGMKDALKAFDKAVGVALDYAKTHENVLVVVTADHETGGITYKNGQYVYTQTSHSSANVPLLVYGWNEFIERDEAIQNRQVARRMAYYLGAEKFPLQIVVTDK